MLSVQRSGLLKDVSTKQDEQIICKEEGSAWGVVAQGDMDVRRASGERQGWPQ